MMRVILFATDGSDVAKVAGDQVKKLLDAFPNAQLHVLHVVKPIAAAVDGFGFVPPAVDDSWEERAKEVLAEARDSFSDYASRSEFSAVHGYPAVSICQFAEQIGADLIVVGSHGYSAVDRLILGSVSNGVVHRSNISVLVVK
jgi:nucleotide-binding universal stress UspA family protein